MKTATCQKCNKDFNYEVTDMGVPGGKEREYIICPYCDESNGSVVTSGFVHSYKIEEKTK
ncbi:MAG: hypothetical protein WAM95_06050 [Bacillus sp. (in: firmicutes)]